MRQIAAKLNSQFSSFTEELEIFRKFEWRIT